MSMRWIFFVLIALLASSPSGVWASPPEIECGFYHWIPNDGKPHSHKVKLSNRTRAYIVAVADGGAQNYLKILDSRGNVVSDRLIEGLRDQSHTRVVRVYPSEDGEEFTIIATFQAGGYIFTNQAIVD